MTVTKIYFSYHLAIQCKKYDIMKQCEVICNEVNYGNTVYLIDKSR